MANSSTFKKVPQTLRSSGRWINWDLRVVEGREAKVPVSHLTGEPINHLDPKNWLSFEQAIQDSPRSSGPGLVIGAPLIGIDIDGVRDPDTSDVEPWALHFIKQLDTYCELSPSGTGFHLWLHGDAGELTQETKDGIEAYATHHYFTVTGQHVEGTPDDVREASKEEIEAIFAQVRDRKIRPQPEPVSDPGKYELLREGKIVEAGYDDASKAVAAFVVCLVDKIGAKPTEIDKAFRESKLFGPVSNGGKTTDWAKKWKRLYKKEIARAIEFRKKNPLRKKQNGQQWTKREAIVIRGCEAARKKQRHLWKPFVPAGMLQHWAGPQAEGKSPVWVDLAARITKGAPWPDGIPNELGPRSVLLMNMEDDFETVILPRFDMAGGDDTKLYYVKGTRLSNDSTSIERGLALDQDMDLLVAEAEKIADLAFVGIDPVTNYLGKLSMNKEEEVRSVLTPLAHLAQKLDIAIATIGHLNRREKGTDPLQRIMGAAAFSGVARTVLMFGPDPDGQDRYDHVVTFGRGTGQEGMRYRTDLVKDYLLPDGETTEALRVIWGGSSSATAEDAVDPGSQKDKGQEAEAAKHLREFLKSGRKPVQECKQFLESGGFDLKKLNETRIKKKAGVDAKQDGRQWFWFLKAMFDSNM